MRPCPPRFLAIAIAVLCLPLAAQPDVIVGDITGPANYTADAVHDAFALGTVSCNVGNLPLAWVSSTNQHPVIGGSLYRLHQGRFMQVGQSWLKHGFTALQQSLCSPCNAHPNGSALGVGCSDPYSASLNGSQSGLGPKFEVNPSTGNFPYPFTSPSYSGNGRRLLVPLGLLAAPGAQWIAEAQYIHPEDAMAGNGNNNCSYRLAAISGGPANYGLSFTAPTVRQQPAINAWAALDPGVVLQTHQVPGIDGGLFTVGVRRFDNGNGTYRFEYAVHNMNCHDSAGGFSVSFDPGASISNPGFASVAYHSGEPIDNLDWVSSIVPGSVSWTTVASFAQDPNGNALRWGTTYNFWFDSTSRNPAGSTITLFRSGGSVLLPAPAIPVAPWETNSPGALLDLNGLTNDPMRGPIQALALTGTNHVLNMGAGAGLPFLAFLAAAPGVPSLLVSPNEQVVNIDYLHPSFEPWFVLPSTMPPGGLSLPFLAPNANFLLSAQLYALDPSHHDSFALSALAEVTVAPSPRVTVEANGPNSFNGVTSSGFWRVWHHGTTPAAIVSVLLSFQGATGPAANLFFDGDEAQMNGVFTQGTTYRNGSAGLCGLDFGPSSPWAGSGFAASNILNQSSATFRTCLFQFQGGLFHNRLFEFDADTDGGATTLPGGAHAGMLVTVAFADSSVLNGVLQADPSNSQRAFVELY